MCWRQAVNRGLAAGAATAAVIATGVVVAYLYVFQNASIFETNKTQLSISSLSVTSKTGQDLGGIEQLVLSKAWAEASETVMLLHIQVKNSGTRATTIDDVLINGRPSAEFGSGARVMLDEAPLSLSSIKPGGKAELTVHILKSDVASGQHLDVTVLTELGNEFSLHVVLP